jgi:hypothetical protein
MAPEVNPNRAGSANENKGAGRGAATAIDRVPRRVHLERRFLSFQAWRTMMDAVLANRFKANFKNIILSRDGLRRRQPAYFTLSPQFSASTKMRCAPAAQSREN